MWDKQHSGKVHEKHLETNSSSQLTELAFGATEHTSTSPWVHCDNSLRWNLTSLSALAAYTFSLFCLPIWHEQKHNPPVHSFSLFKKKIFISFSWKMKWVPCIHLVQIPYDRSFGVVIMPTLLGMYKNAWRAADFTNLVIVGKGANG